MENWADILKAVNTPIQLVGLCILALFVLALLFLRKAEGGHRTAIFGLLVFALIGFASLIVITTMAPTDKVKPGETKKVVKVTNTPATSTSTRTSTTTVRDHRTNETVVVRDHRVASNRIGCAKVDGLTAGDPYLNVREKASGSSNIKDRLQNGHELSIMAKDGSWYNVNFDKNGVNNDGWVFFRYIEIVTC